MVIVMLRLVAVLISWAIFPTSLLYIASGIFGLDYNYLQVYLLSTLIFLPWLVIGYLMINE